MAARRAEHVCFIIHSHQPYCFDLNEMLALPSGLRYRNRFDNQWIQPNLRNGVENLIGERVLVILRDVENNTLIPVRWGAITIVQSIGKIVYFEYLLGDLVEYGTAANVRQQEILDRTATLSAEHGWLPGTAGQPMVDPSVFKSTAGSGFPTIGAANLTAWGNAISAIATAPIYRDVEFLKIVDLVGPDGAEAEIINESYRVDRNTVYALRVFQHVPSPTMQSFPAHSIEVNTFSQHVVALRSKQRAVGKYDMLTFVLRVLNLGPGERTAMEIPHIPDIATNKQALTSIYLPLVVRPARPARLALTGLILLASLVLMFFPTLTRLPGDLVRNVATVVFVLTLTGPSRMLATIWPSWPWGGAK